MVSSVKLNPDGANEPIRVVIESLVVNGKDWNLGGYLDVGLVDTMKDLMVNFVGAVVFSIIGVIYLRKRGQGKLASSLIPVVRQNDDETEEQK